jgi:cysteinyl-tRNA synthetase
MNDDFNAPKALAVLFDLATSVNSWLDDPASPLTEATLQALQEFFLFTGAGVLGILRRNDVGSGSTDNTSVAGVMDLVIKIRNESRKQKLWSLSDMIRDGLRSIGIALEDKKEETVWKKID